MIPQKNIKALLEGVAYNTIEGSDEGAVEQMTFDSRAVGDGDLFFAVRGEKTDGHRFIASAVEKGARMVVCEELPDNLAPQVCYVVVEDTNRAMGQIAANYWDNPSRKLRLVGVTGTNGKTTTATLLYNLVRALGYRAGLISTVRYIVDTKVIESTHTTPDSLRLNRMLAEMVEAGCDYCFMEVSSHSIVQRRIESLRFVGALFTNITHDHLDYHKTFAEYIKAKKGLFDSLDKRAFAVVNIDDRNGQVMVQNCRARVRTLSLRSLADYRCKVVEMGFEGMQLELDGCEFWSRLTGGFNAYNILGVYAAAIELGLDKTEVLTTLSALGSVDGRFETVRSKSGITAIVDYAHTPDALENVLSTINAIRTDDHQLIAVVGCGGDRDATKRPEMARIAADGASLVILTSDNPRTEDPEAILAQMREGLRDGDRYLTIVRREEAIRTAAMLAAPGDIILLAGKGHETYQIIGTEKHHFDDREQISKAFETLQK
ncbi:MAG: UDP-N-acetylmuramoyl-L-alanyl-D-glutamate--2,6-diaminopimelate ligase [Rikenellaceae bacterium]|nr:UDP-N-acetylmuramoyl-L-alanyl-D-glutamate--2,6-diaminopimelate ligase [Rikenellaceae bacterium]